MLFGNQFQVPYTLLLPFDGFWVNGANWILLFLCLQSLWFWDPSGWLSLVFVLPPLCLSTSNGHEVSEAFTGCLGSNSGVMILEPSFPSLQNIPITLGKVYLSSRDPSQQFGLFSEVYCIYVLAFPVVPWRQQCQRASSPQDVGAHTCCA